MLQIPPLQPPRLDAEREKAAVRTHGEGGLGAGQRPSGEIRFIPCGVRVHRFHDVERPGRIVAAHRRDLYEFGTGPRDRLESHDAPELPLILPLTLEPSARDGAYRNRGICRATVATVS